jgi:hypothetical protein
VEVEIMGMQDVTKVIKCCRDKGTVFWGRGEAYVIYDRGSNAVRESRAMNPKDVRECGHKEKGTEGVALSNTFVESVSYDIVDIKWSEGVNSEVYTWVYMIEKAEP